MILRTLLIALSCAPLLGVIYVQHYPDITVTNEEEFAFDKTFKNNMTMDFNVPTSTNRLLMALVSMIDTVETDQVISTAKWDNGGAGETLMTLKPVQYLGVGGEDVSHQVAYLVAPLEGTHEIRVDLGGTVRGLAMYVMSFDNVNQKTPIFDFADLAQVWPQNTSFKTHFSISPTNEALIVDFLTKKGQCQCAAPHRVTPSNQTLHVWDDVGINCPSSGKGCMSISSLVDKPTFVGTLVWMYREATGANPGVYSLQIIRKWKYD